MIYNTEKTTDELAKKISDKIRKIVREEIIKMKEDELSILLPKNNLLTKESSEQDFEDAKNEMIDFINNLKK